MRNDRNPSKILYPSSQDHGLEVFTPIYQGDYGDGALPRTTVESVLMDMRSAILKKDSWWTKVLDGKIRAKWHTELSNAPGGDDGKATYVIDECTHLASVSSPLALPSAVDGVWQSSSLVSEQLADSFAEHVAQLEDVNEDDKDWHPGSNEQVLDLVHPSLYCFVSGVTEVSSDTAEWDQFVCSGEPISLPEAPLISGGWRSAGYKNTSEKYQWLPAEFAVSPEGRPSIKSYINNLHPHRHTGLYHDIRDIFEGFVPLFERVLADSASPRPPRHTQDMYSLFPEFKWGAHADCDSHDNEDAAWDEFNDTKQATLSPVGAFQAHTPAAVDLKGRRLQVITKIGEIVLTPDKPGYPGGAWHVEGMKNESIVATGIYYFGCENVSESVLDFRESVCEPDYEQGDDRGVDIVYGLGNEEALNQQRGSVVTQNGLCLAFPNVYQHRVRPFKLLDPKRPGTRKILVFFLCDPNHHVLSTAVVPPQQFEWKKREVLKQGVFDVIPPPIQDMVFFYLPWMTLEQAKEHRSDLMDERKYFVDKNTQEVFEREFSLCEH